MEAKLLAERLKRAIDAASSNEPAPTGGTIADFYRDRIKVWKDAVKILVGKSGSIFVLEGIIASREHELIEVGASKKATDEEKRNARDEYCAWELVRSNIRDIRKGK